MNPRSLLRSPEAGVVVGYAGLLLALLWARTLNADYVFAAGLATFIAAALLGLRWRESPPGRRGAIAVAGLIVLTGAVGCSAWAGVRLDNLTDDWPAFAARRDARLRQRLGREMSQLFQRGEAVAHEAAEQARNAGTNQLFGSLAELREDSGIAAIAVFDRGGELLAWSGEHRGVLPQEVRLGAAPVIYADRPLFSYLYVARPVRDRGGTAVAIVLLQTGPPVGSATPGGFADRFRSQTGSTVRFGPGADSAASWTYRVDGQPLFHATIQALPQPAAQAHLTRLARSLVVASVALAFLLLMADWVGARGGPRRLALPLVAATPLLAVAPLGAVLPIAKLFSPGLFLLPTPGEVTLGPLLAVLLPVAAFIVSWRSPFVGRRLFAVSVVAGALVMAIGFASGVGLLLDGATTTLLGGRGYLWWGLQLAAVLLLASLVALVLTRVRDDSQAAREPRSGARRSSGRLFIGAGLLLAGTLGIIATVRWQSGPLPPSESVGRLWTTALLWTAPFALLAVGLARERSRTTRLLRTLCAGWLALTFVLPNMWVAHLGARLDAAERSLATLGTRSDPYVAYLLGRFGSSVVRSEGESDLDLLFRSWIASDLAREGYPVQLMLWDTAGEPTLELHLAGAADPLPLSVSARHVLRGLLAQARLEGHAVLDVQPPLVGANQALAVRLPDGRGVTAVVPPRRTLGPTPALLSVLGAPPSRNAQLTLIPAAISPPPGAPSYVRWQRAAQGWRGETLVRYPEGPYRAHLEFRVPSLMVQIARATLIGAVDLALLAVLWLLARAAEGSWRRPASGWFGWLGSFRARVTLALFAFFLIPTAVFGAFAYRALAGEATRSARMLGEHAVQQAARAFPATSNLDSVSDRVGAEVLYYLRGELLQASSPEAVRLGLYGAWMPAPVYLALSSGENLGVSQLLQISGTRYEMSFRALRPAGTLAVPVSLATGDAVTRQLELTHLILFAALMGGILSLILSLSVARTFSRPIGQIRRAAAAVGTGRLDVRLPEGRADEFGELFASFNRMVRRLRRARSREIRTARVLAWGEMARQVAHEIKNPLTPIRLSVQHLRRAFADRSPDFEHILDENVDHVLTEIDRLTEIARAFSRYGLPAESAGPVEAVDVAAVIRETLALYRSGDSTVHYEQALADLLPRGLARADELKEVLVNLLENARAAVGREGTISVAATAREEVIELVVRDDGAGIPPELLPRIFEPRFSTRTSGTGLGLAIVRRLVEGWGGAVRVDSQPAKGTAVHVRIPVAGGGEPSRA